MQREIKFRAWDSKSQRMYYQGEPDLEDIQSFFYHYNDSDELMQFTGLSDKNGKEIYEGDILKSSPYSIGAVLFRNGVFLSEENRDGEPFCYPAFHFSISEIIGNIYENPELMK